MSRIRYIKPDFWDDEKLGELSFGARLLYIGMWNFMDRNGLMEANARLLRAKIFPYDNDLDVSKLLSELINSRRVFVFEHEDKNFIYCPKLKLHQNFHKEEKSKYQIPEAILEKVLHKHHASTVLTPYKHHTCTTETETETLTETETERPESQKKENPSGGTEMAKAIRSKKDQGVETNKAIKAWYLYFRERYGVDYPSMAGKDVGILQSLVKTHSLEKLELYMQVYLQMEDRWVGQECHPLNLLPLKIPKIAVALQSGHANPNDANFWAEVERLINKNTELTVVS